MRPRLFAAILVGASVAVSAPLPAFGAPARLTSQTATSATVSPRGGQSPYQSPEPLGRIDTTAGGPGLGTNPLAQSEGTSDVATHGSDVYIADTAMGVVRHLNTSTGLISNVAGNDEKSLSGIGGPAATAGIGEPQAVATDGAGDVFILSDVSVVSAGSYLFMVPATSGSFFGQTMTAGHIYDIDDSTNDGLFQPGADPCNDFSCFDTNSAPMTANAAGDVFVEMTSNIVYMFAIVGCSGTCRYGLQPYSAGEVVQVAGDGSPYYSGDGGPAIDAGVPDVFSLAVDGAGDLYLADPTDKRVREVSVSTGIIETVTGGLGSGIAIGIGQSGDVAFGHGALYVADSGRGVIRKVDPVTGDETVIAGDGELGDQGASTIGSDPPDGLPVAQTEIDPGPVAVDSNGDVVFVQNNPFSDAPIVDVIPAQNETVDGETFDAGYLYTIVGLDQALPEFKGDGGPAPQASLGGSVAQIALDSAGDLFIADTYNDAIRMVAASNCSNAPCPYGLPAPVTAGDIYDIAGIDDGSGNPQPGFSGDGGLGYDAKLSDPSGVAVDGAGDVFIADTGNNVIRELSPSGIISTYAGIQGTSGNSNGAAASATFAAPSSLTTDSAGDLLVADTTNNDIREIAASGEHDVSSYAGDGTAGYAGDGGLATAAELDGSSLLATDPAGDVYAGDAASNVVREVFASGGSAYAQTMSAGDIYTMAGNGTAGSSTSGPAASWEFQQPTAISIDGNGNLYVYDSSKYQVMEAPAGSGPQWGIPMSAGGMYTVAGNGSNTTSGDGGPGLDAGLGGVGSMASDGAGDILFSGNGGFSQLGIRRLSDKSPFDISEIAGNGDFSYSGDRGPALSAQLNIPGSVVADRKGDVFVADAGNERVRMVAAGCSASCPFGLATTAGDVYTVAGDGQTGTGGDNGPAIDAQLTLIGHSAPFCANRPTDGIALDQQGDLLITGGNGCMPDYPGSDEVRLVAAAPCSSNCPFGLSSTVAGHIYDVAGGGHATVANGDVATSVHLDAPESVAVDPGGDMYFFDTQAEKLYMVGAYDCSKGCPFGLPSTQRGRIYLVAGNGSRGLESTGVPATASAIGNDGGIGFDAAGDLLLADPYNSVVTLVANRNCPSACPYGLSTMKTGDIYYVSGDGSPGVGSLSGKAAGMPLDGPDTVSTAPDGTIYLGLCGQNQIAAINMAGDISDFAGVPNGGENNVTPGGPVGDGGLATKAYLQCGMAFNGVLGVALFGSFGLAYDAPRGNFYLSDPSDLRLRQVGVPTGVANATFVPAHAVGGAATSWTVGFGTSARGALTKGSGKITITAPAGTTLPKIASDYSINGSKVTVVPAQTAADNVTLTVPVGIANSANVSVAISSVTNPPPGTFVTTDASVVTTSDREPGWPQYNLVFTAPALPTSIALSSSRSPVPLGARVTYTAKITPTPNGGSVSFTDNKSPIASCRSVPLSKGLATCQVSYRALGTHAITASYSGDANYLPSSGKALTEVVTKATPAALLFALPGATLTALPVRLTLTVAAPASGLPVPTGTASFYERTKLLARVALSAGKASYTLSFATSGTQPISAAYSGDANYVASKSPIVNVIVTAPGYRLVGGDGGVFDFGSTPYKGGLHGQVIPAPIVGIANTNDAQGYWMVGATGDVYPFGDAGNYGQLSSTPSSPVVGIAATVDSKGYWLAEADGSVVTFGDAAKLPPVSHLTSPVVAIAADPLGGGYWLVTRNGKIFAFGSAHLFNESTGEPPVSGTVADMSVLPNAAGYWLVNSAGTVYAFGAAKRFAFTGGNKPPAGSSFVGIAAFPNGAGYWLVTSSGYLESFGSARYLGDEHLARLTKPIFGISAYP